MNNKRREKLRDAIALLDRAAMIVEIVCDAEDDCVERVPENLQGSNRYEAMENALDNLNRAMEQLDEAKESLSAAIAR